MRATLLCLLAACSLPDPAAPPEEGEEIVSVDAAVMERPLRPDVAVPDAFVPADAVALDTSPPDVQSPDLRPPDACEALVCDDFEAPVINTRLWKTSNAANLKVDTTRAFRGTRALFVRGENRRDGGGKIFLDGAAATPFREGFFGRAWVYLAGRTPRVHSDLVFASGPSSAGTVVWRYGIEAHVFAGNWWGGAGEGAFPSDRFFTRRDAVPVDRWFCMEWQFDSKNNEMRFWLDGAERRSLWRLRTSSSGWPAPTFQRIEIGFQIFGQDSGGDFQLWFDDVALDRARIGCGGPGPAP